MTNIIFYAESSREKGEVAIDEFAFTCPSVFYDFSTGNHLRIEHLLDLNHVSATSLENSLGSYKYA